MTKAQREQIKARHAENKAKQLLIETFWIAHGGEPHKQKTFWLYCFDWNMLMEVVNQIIKLCDKNFPCDPIDKHYMAVLALPLSTRSQDVFEAIVEFIKWYNGEKNIELEVKKG